MTTISAPAAISRRAASNPPAAVEPTGIKLAQKATTVAKTTSARIRPDSRVFGVLAVVVVVSILVAAFAMSVPAQIALAGRSNPDGWQRFLAPVIIDGTIVAFIVIALVLISRGESARFAWAVVGVSTAISMSVNAYHAVVETMQQGGLDIPAVAWASLPPLAVFISTHALSKLVVAPPIGTPDERKAVQVVADNGIDAIFATPGSKKKTAEGAKPTADRARALKLLDAALSTGASKNSIATANNVGRYIIDAAAKEIEASK